LRRRVVGRAQARRQRQVGTRSPRHVGVDDERQNRVIERRGRQFYLAALGELAPERQHARARGPPLLEDPPEVGEIVAAPLALELGELVVALARGEADPRQIEQHCQIAQLTLGELARSLGELGRRRLAAALLQELAVARARLERAAPVEREESL